MLYLSNIIGEKVFYRKALFGKIADIAVLQNPFTHPVAKILIKKKGGQIVELSPSVLDLSQKPFVVQEIKSPSLAPGEGDLYLKENLLDKQVIDIEGKRVVRVNEVVLENGGEPTLVGIDIGMTGILLRLGLAKFGEWFGLEPSIIPWQLIEAFDYQSGIVKVKVQKSKLGFLHHSELAGILQEVGSKERIGILESLPPQKAALALQETSQKTQGMVLQELSSKSLGTIVPKMHVSRIADIFDKVSHWKGKEILQVLGEEKAQLVEQLSRYAQDTAGGLMQVRYFSFQGDKTVQDVIDDLEEQEHPHPEAVLVVGKDKTFLGVVEVKHLFQLSRGDQLKEIVEDREFVHPEIRLSSLLKLFSRYDLRILPVVDHNKKVLGIVTIDRILQDIEKMQHTHAF